MISFRALLFVCFGFSWSMAAASQLEVARLALLDDLMQQALDKPLFPGAVLLVGQGQTIAYLKGFGHLSSAQSPRVTPESLYDLASLTKPLIASVVLRLQELGLLRLSDSLAHYVPELTDAKVRAIRLDALLTHSSGLAAGWPKNSQNQPLAQQLAALRVTGTPGDFVYSDVGFWLLGLVLERASGMPLATLMQEWLFKPLSMHDTAYHAICTPLCLQEPKRLERTAATSLGPIGVVHDGMARQYRGVAGHAGLFGSAGDIARWLQMLVKALDGQPSYFLSPASAQLMFKPVWLQSSKDLVVRGLGLDMHSEYSAPRGELFPLGSVGHTGYTGTSFWFDPLSNTYVILLSNRVYVDERVNLNPLRSALATVVASAITGVTLPMRLEMESRVLSFSAQVEPSAKAGYSKNNGN